MSLTSVLTAVLSQDTQQGQVSVHFPQEQHRAGVELDERGRLVVKSTVIPHSIHTQSGTRIKQAEIWATFLSPKYINISNH